MNSSLKRWLLSPTMGTFRPKKPAPVNTKPSGLNQPLPAYHWLLSPTMGTQCC